MRVSAVPPGFEDGEPAPRPVSRPVFLPALDAAVHGLPTLRTTLMPKRGILRLHLKAHHTPRRTVHMSEKSTVRSSGIRFDSDALALARALALE